MSDEVPLRSAIPKSVIEPGQEARPVQTHVPPSPPRPRLFHSSGPFLLHRPGRPLTTIVSDAELRGSTATIDSEAFMILLAPKKKNPTRTSTGKLARPT